MDRSYYNNIINYLMNGNIGPGETDQEKVAIVKRASKYKVIGGVLYHKGKGRGIEDLRLVLVDLAEQENAIRTCHVSEASGRHFGRNKTSSLLASKYYWRMMYTDVMQYVANCPSCSLDREVLEHKSARDRTKVWKLVEVEFMEDFHTTRHYTFHLLRIADVFSKWTRCVPMHSNSERNIVGTILELFGTFGFPVAIRFVNCKAVPAYLAALQKELELFVKRASEATPILSAAGVDVDGILTCFQDMTVHVSVEDEGENCLSDFASFEEYLRTFQSSRGCEAATSPVFHVLFGRHSVLDEPIRQWYMDKITFLKKQNPYGWASQMPFYVFCLQNSIPPTMDQSPFSIMFNRQPPQETLWCWYGNTQNVQVVDETSNNFKKSSYSKSSSKKKESNRSGSTSMKRSHPTSKVDASAKKIRLDGDKTSSSRDSLLTKVKSKEKTIRTSDSGTNIYKKEFNSLRRHKREDKLSTTTMMTPQLSKDVVMPSRKFGSSHLMSFEESLNATPEYPKIKTYSNKKLKSGSLVPSHKDNKLKESTGLIKSKEEGAVASKKSKDAINIEKSVVDGLAVNKKIKDAVEPVKSERDHTVVTKKSKEKNLENCKKSKDSSSKEKIKTDGSSSPKKSKEHGTKSKESTDGVEKKSKVGKLLVKSNGDGFVSKKVDDCTVFRKSNNKVVITRTHGDCATGKTSKHVSSKTKSASTQRKGVDEVTNSTTENDLHSKSVDAVKGAPSPKNKIEVLKAVPTVDDATVLFSPEGEILKLLSIDQPQSTLKKRFPGRPYKKNRKYVDMATEVPVHKPQESPSPVKGSPVSERTKVIKSASQENAVKAPKLKVNGEEALTNSTRYSFRQNLKPRGPSSYVHRFIAISSSKRTSTNDSEVEVFGVHPLDPVEEIVCDSSGQESAAEEFVVTEALTALPVEKPVQDDTELTEEELETLGALPLANGVCDDDEDTLLYESELCIDEGFLILAEQDLQLQVPENESVPLEIKDDEMADLLSIQKRDTDVVLPEDVVTGDAAVDDSRLQETKMEPPSLTEVPIEESKVLKASEETSDVVSKQSNELPTCDGLADGISSKPSSEQPLLSKIVEANVKPSKVVLSRLSSFVVQRALEGSIQLRTVTNNGIVTLFMGDLKLAKYSLVETKVNGNPMCTRVIQKRKYSEKKRFKCSMCPKTFVDTAEELSLHMRFHDDTGALACPICKKTGQSWTNLFKHFFTHKDLTTEMDAKYKKACTLCQKVFATEEGLAKHTRLVHPPESDQFRCGECELTFKDPKSFKRHAEIHDDITYECGECGYTTKAHYNYILHAKFHESQRLDFAAKEGQSTRVINATLDEEGQLSCGQCKFKTMDDQQLIQHMQTCHSQTKTFYCCDQCNKKFRSQPQLCSHILMHKSVTSELFMCKLCPYTAKFKNIIHRHAKQHHPNFALKDVVQGPRNARRPGRRPKEQQKKVEEEDGEVKEECADPEDDIPTATVVVHTDENGEVTVCEDEIENDGASQIICVDSEGNFVLDDTGQTLQFLEGEQQLVLLQVNPQEAAATS